MARLFKRADDLPKRSLWQRIKDIALTDVAVLVRKGAKEGSLEQIEELLLEADFGVPTTLRLVEEVDRQAQRGKIKSHDEFLEALRQGVESALRAGNSDASLRLSATAPTVILVVGVNGVGKTTTIGKLAAQFSKRGKKVVLGAADTFRAAAVDQLKLWGERIGVPVVAKGMNTDPSAVAFEAVEEGQRTKADVVIIDTAGRLHTKVNLMAELSKIRRVIQKVIPAAPHEVLLVLDGSTGQNALIQAREFTKATEVTALAITKLDGTAKGGVVIGISDEFKIPVKYIGVGEQVDDLHVFNKMEFVDSLFRKK